jgi:hypothetical protein
MHLFNRWPLRPRDRIMDSRIARTEGFEGKVPIILQREFQPSKMTLDERMERLELIHIDLIAQFERNWIKRELPGAVPEQVQLLAVDEVKGQLLIRRKDGSLELLPKG